MARSRRALGKQKGAAVRSKRTEEMTRSELLDEIKLSYGVDMPKGTRKDDLVNRLRALQEGKEDGCDDDDDTETETEISEVDEDVYTAEQKEDDGEKEDDMDDDSDHIRAATKKVGFTYCPAHGPEGTKGRVSYVEGLSVEVSQSEMLSANWNSTLVTRARECCCR